MTHHVASQWQADLGTHRRLPLDHKVFRTATRFRDGLGGVAHLVEARGGSRPTKPVCGGSARDHFFDGDDDSMFLLSCRRCRRAAARLLRAERREARERPAQEAMRAVKEEAERTAQRRWESEEHDLVTTPLFVCVRRNGQWNFHRTRSSPFGYADAGGLG